MIYLVSQVKILTEIATILLVNEQVRIMHAKSRVDMSYAPNLTYYTNFKLTYKGSALGISYLDVN